MLCPKASGQSVFWPHYLLGPLLSGILKLLFFLLFHLNGTYDVPSVGKTIFLDTLNLREVLYPWESSSRGTVISSEWSPREQTTSTYLQSYSL